MESPPRPSPRTSTPPSRLHGQGWHSRYHDETLVQGLAPHDLASYLLQRDRWARGNLAVLRTPENPAIAAGLTLKQRASYLSSLLAYFVPLQRVGLGGRAGGHARSPVGFPLHATLWQFALFWLPWMAFELDGLGDALPGPGHACGTVPTRRS